MGVLEHITQLSRVVWADETEDVERLIDHMDNEFILSNPREGNLMLHQDLQLISDLVVLLVLATAAGARHAHTGRKEWHYWFHRLFLSDSQAFWRLWLASP